jgi:cytidylate kinase
MGRGRAKAKQTKVARQLKYGGPHTDLGQLQAELAADRGAPLGDFEHDDTDDEDYDGYVDYDELDGVSEPGNAAGR